MTESSGEVTADLQAAVAALRRGEVVAFPTETFYGLGVDALDGAAIERLKSLKGRGTEKAISVLVTDEAMLSIVVAEVSPLARRLMEQHWPGALTLALPARAGLPEALVLDGCVAVRQSPHPVARALVAAFGGPVTATSANPAGATPVTTAAATRAYFPSGCVVLDGGETPGGQPSTLARVRGETLELLRDGAIRLADGHDLRATVAALMAQIAPFHGLRFDLSRGADAATLLAPPYDVISEVQREALEKSNPHNVVRLDLPRGEGDARYQNANESLERWMADGTLRRDEKPAIYRYEQTFSYANAAGSKQYVRRGFIALLKLEPFSARVVLPHEHTLSGPKVDRLKLMRATRAHFSQIFALYRDPAAEAETALAALDAQPPALDATTPDGCRHRLWAVTDPKIVGKVASVLAPKQVMIADGHHRYETMLNLRDELRPADRQPGQSLADWGTVFFARAEDPGLLVLPTHRLVNGLPAGALAALREKARPWFETTEGNETTSLAIEQRLLREGAEQVTFALREAGRPATLWLKLRPDANLESLGPPALRMLDVTVLHGLLLGPLLGIGADAMAKQSFLTHTHDLDEALARIEKKEVQGGFLMNTTRVDQVLGACEAGFVLPQKSTYFQPKLATGLVMARIDPQEKPAGPSTVE